MSAVAVLIHSARLFATVLTFVCFGSLIQLALEAILLICCMFLLGTAAIGLVALRLIWRMLVVYPAMAGLTGLIVGICEVIFGRTSAWVVLAISLVVALPGLVQSAAMIIYLFDQSREVAAMADAGVAWLALDTEVIVHLSFLASMIACWKFTEMEKRGKAPVAGGHPSL